MAIYRGDGGAGDANTDVTVNQVATLTSEAAASASAAASSATSATSSASSASSSATSAASSASAASTSATNAASSATSAASSATSAASSASDAAASATLAASFVADQTGHAGEFLTTDGTSTSWTPLVTGALNNIVEDTTPQLGGDLYTNFHDVLFEDNDYIKFGSNNELQIYSNAGTSYIKEVGSGSLNIQSNSQVAIQGTNGEFLATFNMDGASNLYYNGSNRLSTTVLGATLSGELTTTGGNSTNWQTAYTFVNSFPSQTGNSGKYLTTDGSALSWAVVNAGAQAGIFWENDQTVTSNYTITSGKNAMSAGPISINTGVTVSVPTGSEWTIV